MSMPIAIIAGEPNSISSEIIFKSWQLRKQYTHKPLFIIGSVQLLTLQKKKLHYQIKIRKIDNSFKISDLKSNELPVYDIDYKQKNSFEKISNKSNKYILKCFNQAIILAKSKKILVLLIAQFLRNFYSKGKIKELQNSFQKNLVRVEMKSC